MKIKYYLRGLGLGILFTALVMGVSLSGEKQNLSNDEIISRAKELGMIESEIENMDLETPANTIDENDDLVETVDLVETDDIVLDPELELEISSNELEEEQVSDNVVEPSVSDNQTQEENQERTEEESEVMLTVLIHVYVGEGSYTVSKKIADVNLIEDAKDFDQYLSLHGYDKRITTGDHYIPIGATYEEIAIIISSK